MFPGFLLKIGLLAISLVFFSDAAQSQTSKQVFIPGGEVLLGSEDAEKELGYQT